MTWDKWPEACRAKNPGHDFQFCDLEAGHPGPHEATLRAEWPQREEADCWRCGESGASVKDDMHGGAQQTFRCFDIQACDSRAFREKSGSVA